MMDDEKSRRGGPFVVLHFPACRYIVLHPHYNVRECEFFES